MCAKFRLLQRAIETNFDNAIKAVQAITCLHNFLMAESENKMNPTNFADSPDDEDGLWRRSVEPLPSIQMTSKYASKNKREADEMRSILKDYFLSDEGAVPWQNQKI